MSTDPKGAKFWWLISAGLWVVGCGFLWLAQGAHAGWTRHSQFVTFEDPVTGLTGVRVEPAWIPGLDFLVLSGVSGVLFFGILGWLGNRLHRGRRFQR